LIRDVLQTGLSARAHRDRAVPGVRLRRAGVQGQGVLDIFWLRDESLEDTENLPAPELIAAEIVEDLQTALD
jgi:hypothetical protein